MLSADGQKLMCSAHGANVCRWNRAKVSGAEGLACRLIPVPGGRRRPWPDRDRVIELLSALSRTRARGQSPPVFVCEGYGRCGGAAMDPPCFDLLFASRENCPLNALTVARHGGYMGIPKTYNRTKEFRLMDRFSQPARPNDGLILRCALRCYQVPRFTIDGDVESFGREDYVPAAVARPPIWGKPSSLGRVRVVLEPRTLVAPKCWTASGSENDELVLDMVCGYGYSFCGDSAQYGRSCVARGSGRADGERSAGNADQRRTSTTLLWHTRRRLHRRCTAAWALCVNESCRAALQKCPRRCWRSLKNGGRIALPCYEGPLGPRCVWGIKVIIGISWRQKL